MAPHCLPFLLEYFLLLSVIRLFLYLEELTYSVHMFHLRVTGQGLSHTLVSLASGHCEGPVTPQRPLESPSP